MELKDMVKDIGDSNIRSIEISISEFPEVGDYIYIYFSEGQMIGIRWPRGHGLSEEDIQYSDGKGWK